MTQRKEYGSIDAAPVVLYAKRETDNILAFPLLQDDNGRLLLSSFVPFAYDYIALTYVAAGNGAGEIETATYKTGGASGTTVATLTLTYDSNNNIASVART